LQKAVKDRGPNSCAKLVTDIVKAGFKKFESSSLATFNKKISVMKQGGVAPVEVDDIAPCGLVAMVDTDDSEMEPGELSVLHDSEE